MLMAGIYLSYINTTNLKEKIMVFFVITTAGLHRQFILGSTLGFR